MAIDHASTNWECTTMMIVWRNRIAKWYVVVLPLLDAGDLGVGWTLPVELDLLDHAHANVKVQLGAYPLHLHPLLRHLVD